MRSHAPSTLRDVAPVMQSAVVKYVQLTSHVADRVQLHELEQPLPVVDLPGEIRTVGVVTGRARLLTAHFDACAEGRGRGDACLPVRATAQRGVDIFAKHPLRRQGGR